MGMFGGLSSLGVGDIVAYVKLDGITKFNTDLNRLNQDATKFGQVLDRALTASVLAGAAAFATATLAAAKFEKGMANVSTLLDTSHGEMQKLSGDLLEIASNVPDSIDSLSKGLYDLISSGATAANATDALALAAQAAAAGLTTTDSAIRAGMATINAYALSMEELNKIYDIQFQTVNKGVITYEELTAAIGTVLPSAANLGVSLEDVYGAIAHITKAGIDAQSTTTYLSRAFESMIENADKWKEMGISIYDAQGKFRGLISIIKDLSGKLEGLTTEAKQSELAHLNLEVRASRAILTMTNNYGGFVATMGDVSNSAGALDAAFKKQTATFDAQAKMLKNNLQIAFIQLGNNIIPVLTTIVKYLNEHDGALKAIVYTVGGAVIVFGSLVAVWKVYNAISTAWIGLGLAGKFASLTLALNGTTLSMSAAVASFGVLTVAAGGLYLAIKKMDEIKDTYENTAKFAESANQKLRENALRIVAQAEEAKKAKQEIVKYNDELARMGATAQATFERWDVWSTALSTGTMTMRDASNGTKLFAEREKELSEWMDSVGMKVVELDPDFGKLNKTTKEGELTWEDYGSALEQIIGRMPGVNDVTRELVGTIAALADPKSGWLTKATQGFSLLMAVMADPQSMNKIGEMNEEMLRSIPSVSDAVDKLTKSYRDADEQAKKFTDTLGILNDKLLKSTESLSQEALDAWEYFGHVLPEKELGEFINLLGTQTDELLREIAFLNPASKAWEDHAAAILKNNYTVKLLTGETENAMQYIADFGLDAEKSRLLLQALGYTVTDTTNKINNLATNRSFTVTGNVNMAPLSQKQLQALYSAYFMRAVGQYGGAMGYGNWIDQYNKGNLLLHTGGMIEAHSGTMLGSANGLREVPFIGLESEMVLRPEATRKFGADRLEAFNATLNPSALTGGRSNEPVNVTVTPNITIHEATNRTWYEVSKSKIDPSMRKLSRNTVKAGAFSR